MDKTREISEYLGEVLVSKEKIQEIEKIDINICNNLESLIVYCLFLSISPLILPIGAI